MDEIKVGNVPIPISSYIFLIRDRKSPYWDIAEFLKKDMEMRYSRTGGGSEVTYTINPRMLQEEIERKVKNEKLTTVNVCRSVLAFLYGSTLEEEKDFFVTTTSSGRRNYHVRVNNRTLGLMSRML